MGICAECYEEKEINLIEDLYSTCSNLQFNKKRVTTISRKTKRTESLNVSTKVNMPEILGNDLIDVDAQPIIVKMTKSPSKIIFEGELKLTFLYTEDGQMQVSSKNAELPFQISIDDLENAENVEIMPDIEVESNDCRVEGGAINCNANLKLDVGLHENRSLDIIDEISEEDLEDIQDYSVIIYIVKKGDTLWNIAKKFKSTVDDIVRVNGIENPDKISEGEKLYIPKTVRTVSSHV